MLSSGKRLRSELQSLRRNPDESILLEVVDDEDIRCWRAVLQGPAATPYVGFEFDLDVAVGQEYPLGPPSIKMRTKCFHPNIHFDTGEICLDILKKEWTPAWSLQSACRAILVLLSDPAADSPLNCDAGNMVRAGDLHAYHSMARMYSVEFARRPPPSMPCTT